MSEQADDQKKGAKGRAPKAKRRSRANDSVYFDKSKDRWVARVVVGQYANGQPKRVKRLFPSQVEAEKGLRDLQVKANTGRIDTQVRMTLSEWLDRWLTTHRKQGSPRTQEFYAGFVERHIKPVLGKRQMEKLQPGEIEALYRGLEAKGLSRSAYAAHQTLRAALKKAVMLGVLHTNPMDRVEAPKQGERDEAFLTLDQMAAFLGALEGEPDEVRALATVGICTGLRLGELTGIRWEDVDLESGAVRVRAQLVTRGTVELAPLKTKKSNRTLFLPLGAIEALKMERARQSICGFENPLGLALLNSVGSPWHQKNANGKLRAICSKAKVPVLSAHALFRHGYATVLLKEGVPLHSVSRMLGHSSTNLTGNLYGHHELEATRRASEQFGAALDRAKRGAF